MQHPYSSDWKTKNIKSWAQVLAPLLSQPEAGDQFLSCAAVSPTNSVSQCNHSIGGLLSKKNTEIVSAVGRISTLDL